MAPATLRCMPCGEIAAVPRGAAGLLPGADALVPATLIPGPEAAFAAQMRAKGMAPPRWFKLAPQVRKQFDSLFARFDLDIGKLTFSTGGAFGQAGLTLGNTILLFRGFSQRSFTDQLGLLAHEITHSVQYKKLGWISFLVRYRREWRSSGGNPYMKPGDPAWEALRRAPIASIDPVDSSHYLDQLCDRFRVAAETGV